MTYFGSDLDFDALSGSDDIEEGDGTDDAYKYGGTEARIFLVDAHKRMLERRNDGEDESLKRSPFIDVLNAILVSLQRRVFHSNSSLYSILLYGVKTAKNPLSTDGLYILQDLNLVDPDRIKELEEMIKEGDNSFSDTIGHSTRETSLGDALWLSSRIFAESRTNLGEKRIFIFSNEDDPHRDDPAAKRKALAKGSDLKELGIDLTLIPLMPMTKTNFNPKPFFADLLQLTTDEELNDLARRTTSNWEELEVMLKGLEDKRRRLAALDFHLGKVDGEDVSLSVGLYSMVREKPNPLPVYRSARDNKTEIITVTRKFLGGDDGDDAVLLPSDIKKGILYGGRNILFEEDEITQIKDFGPSGIRLLGFTSLSALKVHYHISPASFIYPDEASTQGSTRLFMTLHKCCLAKKKMGIVRLVARQHAAPVMAALIPQREEKAEDGFQTFPPGFWIKPLPFADDFRDLSSVVDATPQSESDLNDTKEITDRIVKKLTFKFDPRNFENPHLRTLYGIIEAMALERGEKPKVEDATQPPNERIDKKIFELCSQWKDLSWHPGYVPGKAPPLKRPASSKEAPSTTKKKKEDSPSVSGDDGLSTTEAMGMAEGKKLGKLTVPVLKKFCKDNAITIKGTKKDDFIKGIEAYFGIE